MNEKERQKLERLLLQRIKKYKPELDAMLQRMSDHWSYEFDFSHNQDWERHTRPLLEAFFHSTQNL